ncbi:hypothetical protein GCM10009763_03320 [Dermacoccus profundi]|uniref:Uncharacterized protein n=1 Tax=Dermacoccus profundi TaxID=322602 RepID=A0ABP4NAX3_9MICO
MQDADGEECQGDRDRPPQPVIGKCEPQREAGHHCGGQAKEATREHRTSISQRGKCDGRAHTVGADQPEPEVFY